jgi:hypothetical protein
VGESFSQFANARSVDGATLINAIMEAPDARAAELVSAGELSHGEINALPFAIEERVGEANYRTDVIPRGIHSAGD